ncbi:hypothetical protein L1887_41906 [Cichorium endivia]|nr:hypothetical protein L1887_41906 [Cichorium endivia]
MKCNLYYHNFCLFVMSNYSSHDGVLYCKTHFEQLFKETGNYSKNFRTSKPIKDNSVRFYELRASTRSYLRAPQTNVKFVTNPFMQRRRCAHGGCPLTQSSYAALNGVLYCRTHFAQLFMEKGTLSHVLESANRKKNVDENKSETTEEAEQSEE